LVIEVRSYQEYKSIMKEEDWKRFWKYLLNPKVETVSEREREEFRTKVVQRVLEYVKSLRLLRGKNRC